MTATTTATAIAANVNPLLCAGEGAGVTDGSGVGEAAGTAAGAAAGADEFAVFAVADGEGEGATLITTAENAGLRANIATMNPAATEYKRRILPPSKRRMMMRGFSNDELECFCKSKGRAKRHGLRPRLSMDR